jgi:O-antigen/teichoic acid export membrane protein
MALVPPLLSSLSRILRDGEKEQAQTIARNALRVMFWLLPVAGMIAGAGEDISEFVFGPDFHSSGPILAVLIFGAVARSIIAVATSVMIANSRPDLPLVLFGPLIPLSIGAYIIVIPSYQALGAAYVTTLSACTTALIMVATIYRKWNVRPPIATVLRCSLSSVLACVLSAAWPAHSSYLLIKLCVICFLIGLGLLLFGEFSVSHFRSLWSVFSKESLAVSTAEDI